MGTFILTMVISIGGQLTSFTQEYSSKQACETAKNTNREALSNGTVTLATCTPR